MGPEGCRFRGPAFSCLVRDAITEPPHGDSTKNAFPRFWGPRAPMIAYSRIREFVNRQFGGFSRLLNGAQRWCRTVGQADKLVP